MLIICLLAVCLVGCSEEPAVTPTDVSVSTEKNDHNLAATPQEEAQTLLEKEQALQEESFMENVQELQEQQSTESMTPSVENPAQSGQLEQEVPPISGAVPAPPLQFTSGDVLGDFKNWIETVPLITEDVVPGSSEYYYYLKPGYQDMLIEDRYYLLPNTPAGYTLHSIFVYARSIAFNFKSKEGEIFAFDVGTEAKQLPLALSSSKQKFVEYEGIQYLQEIESSNDDLYYKRLYRNYEKYTIGITFKDPYPTTEDMADMVTFNKVQLPPLKEVMK